ncbi:DNA repair protein RecO [Acidisoma silvae]|uniref:DNA repair protein RecO n=1 Tax=Acidisoma silvae TaxID=2802396 RepID=A0A964DXV7_9PROT|nr:DNA repair protein RecO [Acidisoma silvae]MCB8874289.1 DNA repair protein RecO [Acidisoma silvae]
MAEWEEPGIVLDARAYGDADLIVSTFTAGQGLHKGLVRGGASRRQVALWQSGNLAALRWVGRLPEQLGHLTGEMVQAIAPGAMDDALSLALLRAACATAAGALPEREPQPASFSALLNLLPRIAAQLASPADLVRFELSLLTDLGYGLDLSSCAVTGATQNLAFVSPRTGRAVTTEAAGAWAGKLLPLPAFLRPGANIGGEDAAEWRDALRLTGHFLERDAFGHHHQPLPEARRHLYQMVETLAARAD